MAERSMSLWQIDETIAQLMEMRDEVMTRAGGPGEDGPAELDVIESELARYIGETLPTKVDGIRGFFRQEEAIADAAEAEEKRYKAIAAMRRGRVARLKDWVIAAMHQAGKRKMEGRAGGTLTICGNGGVQSLTFDPAILPDEFRDVVVRMPLLTWRRMMPDEVPAGSVVLLETSTQRIREALARDEGVPGAHLEPRGEHLRVK